jgi:hypothetical protein
MLSKNNEILAKIIGLTGKQVPVADINKHSQSELDEAERWAVIYNAKMQEENLQKSVPEVPKMPEWLFAY